MNDAEGQGGGNNLIQPRVLMCAVKSAVDEVFMHQAGSDEQISVFFCF